MEKTRELVSVYCMGALGYTLIEILWRGYSHWTMALTGGASFLFLYCMSGTFAREAMWKKCLAGCLFITCAELLVGFTVNILLGWAVWDYSDRLLNFHGQICVLYSLLWFVLCIPAILFCGWLHRKFGASASHSNAAHAK